MFVGPNVRCEKLQTAISGRGPGPAGKEKEIYEYPSGGGRRQTDLPMLQSNSKQNTVAECELYKEERDVLEGGMRDVNEGGMESFDALGSREKKVAILGDR